MMQKKLTITIDQSVYDGLYRRIGRRKIGRFIESLVRPHVLDSDLESGYREMAEDEEREAEAVEWTEALIENIEDEPR
jgi:hypothetical protein